MEAGRTTDVHHWSSLKRSLAAVRRRTTSVSLCLSEGRCAALCRTMSGGFRRHPAAARRFLFPRSSSGRSLNERFSQVLQEQLLVRSSRETFEPVPQLQARTSGSVRVRVERAKRAPPCRPRGGVHPKWKRRPHSGRKSVWTRLGGLQKTPHRSIQGFWSFRNKYRWRARCSASYRKWRRQDLQLKRGGAFPTEGRGLREWPTKEQLDAELDDYMSLSRSSLDRQLDEYMAMAGQVAPP